jgi:dipeptidyl-peptidase-4
MSIRWWTSQLLRTLALAFASGSLSAEAQTSGDPWLRSISATRSFQLGRPTRPTFTPDAATVLFLRAEARSPRQSLFAFDLASGTTREVLTANRILGGATEDLSPEEKARRERQRITAGGLVSFELSRDGRHVLVPLSGQLYWVEWKTGESRRLPTGPGITDPKLSPDGSRVAYVRDHDVWTVPIDGGRESRVTRGGTAEVTHGEAEFVAQEEMDRSTGWWWSPDGSQIVFEEADHRGVEVWHVTDPYQPGQPAAPQFYPRPGKSNVVVRLGITGIRGGRTRWIRWDTQTHPYLARVQWHAAGGLTLSVQSRDQRSLVVHRVDPKSGRTSPLITESDAAWVNLDHSSPRWIENGRRFLWTTERSGRWELEVRHADGSPDRVVVPGQLGWQSFIQWDESHGTVWFHATEDPTQQHVWSAPIQGGAPTRHTQSKGLHTATVARNGAAWTITTATPTQLARTTVHRASGGNPVELPSVAEEPTRPVHATYLHVGEGEGWHAKVVRPSAFVAGHKYPVIASVYGGPHSQVVRQNLATSLTDQWLADQGFIVVAMDGRGTPGRGRDWERAIFGKLGPVPLAEQSAALLALAARVPEMDTNRVGITGWSFGGYLSAYAVLRRPDLFKAAVAGAPVTDWEDYDTHYTERYMGVPPGAEAEAAYRESSCLPWASGLQRPLLLIHGTRDDNVFFRHTLRLTDALLRAGRPLDVLPLPGFTHMVPDPVVAEQRWQRTAEYFRRHLGEPRPR